MQMILSNDVCVFACCCRRISCDFSAIERHALLAFKKSTGRNREVLADWMWNKPTCTWKFVHCSSAGRVTEL